MVDKSAYAIAHREARGRLSDQMTGLKELRDRAVTVVSVSTGAITIAVSATAALADDRGAMDGLAIFAGVVALEAFVLVVVGVVTVFAPVTGQWAIDPAEVSAMADTSDSVGGGRFDVRPLVDRAGGVMALARLVGCSRGVVHRAAHGAGVRLVEADAWSCALGLHPAEVWGDLWWDAVAV